MERGIEKYTFENFTVTDNNKLAYSPSLYVANSPMASYSPLFLYGGNSLERTHLMYAIANKVKENDPELNIIHIYFIKELINAVKEDKHELFYNKYVNADVLLIEDIQFMNNKKYIQNELFHIFRKLYEKGKKIIISSNKSPRDNLFVDTQLIDYIELGLIVNISCCNNNTCSKSL